MKKTSIFLITALFSIVSFAQDFTLAAEKSIHSVVYIQCQYHQQTSYFSDFFNNDFFSDPFSSFFGGQPRTRTYMTSGSGVIISEDGYIVTNNHVVSDADSITVTLNDRREFPAKIIGTDASADLAVIKIDTKGLTPLAYGNSDNVKIGEWVLAVGNPFNLTSTVTAGIVSAKARNLNILSSKQSQNTLTSFIQTDAAMNPGNSGGALVNTSGELIGINAAIASSTGSYTGYSFAIPVNTAKKVIHDLIAYGVTQKASAGISIQEIDSRLTSEKKLSGNEGMYIGNVVKGGAAEKAGLKEGDVITKINGKSVNTSSEVNEIMSQLSPNDVAHFTVTRNGQTIEKDLTLLNERNTTEIMTAESTASAVVLGATIREINSLEQQNYSLSKGLVIEKTGKSPLARAGIKNGFVITAIDGNVNLTIDSAKKLAEKKGKTTIEGFYPNSNRSYYFIVVL